MKNSTLFRFVIAIAFLCLISSAAAAQDSGVGASGYTSIDYDEATNTVRAYSETDIDYDLSGNYQTYVQLVVTKSNGSVAASGSALDNSGLGYAEVVLSFAGEADTTYTAIGRHNAHATLYDYYDYAPYETFYHDEYYLSYFSNQGIYEPWFHFFESPGYRQATVQIQTIRLGRTYDSVSIVPSLNRGQIQAQGSNPPVEKSRAWAQLNVPKKSEGLANINSLWDSLTRSERRERGQAYVDAYHYIQNSPREGRPFNGKGGKNFFDPQRTDPSARIDVVIITGLAFKDDDF